MNAYVQDTNWLSKRAIVFVAIVLIHVLIIWAFASGLAMTGVKYVATIIEASQIDVQKPKDLPPPPPPVELKERPPVQVVAPDINISVPADAPPPPITQVTTTPITPPAPRPVVASTPLSGGNFSSAQDYYPAASQRANEEGRPVIHYCVSAGNRLTSVEVKTSSGFDRLDQAGVSLVKAGHGFKAATVEGRPVDSCKDVAVKFQLKGDK